MLSSEPERRNLVADWIARIGVAVFFLIFGLEKFGSDPHWTKLFHEIGWGDWFRYFTGAVEILGGVLVMIPRIAFLGFAMLACTMLGAAGFLIFAIGSAASAILPAVIFLVLVTLGWRERDLSAKTRA
jgi:putative oxidoreductase